MQKRKIKPGSFQDRAEAKIIFNRDKKIDLRKLWNMDKDEDEELDPKIIENLNKPA